MATIDVKIDANAFKTLFASLDKHADAGLRNSYVTAGMCDAYLQESYASEAPLLMRKNSDGVFVLATREDATFIRVKPPKRYR